MSDKVVYVIGYPRSGTVWLTRLLSDLLDSPIYTLSLDSAWEDDFCQTGEGGYIIYKTHWRADEWAGTGKVVFIQRDPRDVAVSAMYYQDRIPNDDNGLMGVIKTMVLKEPGVDFQTYHVDGAYEKWVRDWMQSWPGINSVNIMHYEWLHNFPYAALSALAWQLENRSLIDDDVRRIVNRNSFDKWKPHHPHSMRKGIIGDWRNHFRRAHGELITEHLGQLMVDMGYVDDLNWWKELPE